jgi:NhaA family Na+:H+ antiporter
VRWRHLVGIGVISGLGFTMSIFISELAFPDPAIRKEAKLGILCASLIAGSAGFLLLRSARPVPGGESE